MLKRFSLHASKLDQSNPVKDNAALKPLEHFERAEKAANDPVIVQRPTQADTASSSPDGHRAVRLVEAKVEIHRALLDILNLSVIEKVPREQLVEQVMAPVVSELRARNLALSKAETDLFANEIVDEMIGLGPLETLLKDDTIADIMINGHKQIFVERFGKIELSNIRFKDDDHLMRIITKIVSAVGRRVDEFSPLCDARLADGSRINVAIPPAAVDGPMVSIRKFKKTKLSMDALVESHSLSAVMADVLQKAVWGRVSILISGGTGTGKTTALNALSSAIPPDERLITIEDAAELQLQQPHVVRLETRPPNLEGKGEIRQRELVKNSLRMRPERIILGEVRGEEAFDMLQAMNTGHEGSLATIHSNAPREALLRLESMVSMAGLLYSEMSIRSQIASAIGLVVQLERLTDGTRRFVSVSEITGMEGSVIQMHELFKFKKLGMDADGKVLGEFRATGVRPKFATQLLTRGVNFPAHYFDPAIIQ